MTRRSALGAAVVVAACGGATIAASTALAASSAPTHGKTTCAIAGDECNNAIAYANAHTGGGARVLAVEADTEAHGGAVKHRVFDIRLQTNSGVYVEHVYRNDGAPYSDGIWWQSRAENQSPGGQPPTSEGSSKDHSSGSSSPSSMQRIGAAQAASDATSFATHQGMQVLGVKREQLNAKGQKDYYQVKLQLGRNGHKHGTTTVWVDATSSPGTVTAASGSGLEFRDSAIVSPATADSAAVSAVGAGHAYKTTLHGGKWRWYWVFVRNGSTKYKVGVDAVSGVVTQVRHS